MNTTTPSTGRAWFLVGLALVILGPLIYNVQVFTLHQFVTPWYVAVLGTLGVVLILGAVGKRWTVVRLIGLVLCGLLVAFEWAFLVSFSRSPEFAGPTVGNSIPAFAALRPDGTPFTDADVRGTPTVLLFFRGHW